MTTPAPAPAPATELTYALIKTSLVDVAVGYEAAIAGLLEGMDPEISTGELLKLQHQIAQMTSRMELSATMAKKLTDMIQGIIQKI